MPLNALPAPPANRPLWDVFCRVIDNLGDIGVCWRFCSGLAARGQSVRLWIDAPDALTWMAPGALEGQVPHIEVHHWTEPLPGAATVAVQAADVWVEAFGCDPAAEWLDWLTQRVAQGHAAPVWINLEYMSAEPYVERFHGLPSPIMSGPLSGQTKGFYYPGFTPATGGLLRENGLMAARSAFDASAWLRQQGVPNDPGTRRVSLFCYEPPVLAAVLREAGEDTTPSQWLVTHGRAQAAVAQTRAGASRLHPLPLLPQTDFDHLLWACDFNCVRGEDSLVRALWAGQAFVWHIYPQHDNAHHAKLEAFLDWLQAPTSWRRFHRHWNGIESPQSKAWPGWSVVDEWRDCALAARERLLAQPDLLTQLLEFVTKRR